MANAFRNTITLYRDAYSGHPKEVWGLTILTLINRMGTMVLPFMAVYITTILGFTPKEAGVIISAFGFGSFGGAYLGGKLSDRIGANAVIAMSLFAAGVFFIFMQYVTSFGGLFAMIFLTAFFGEAYRPALMVSIGNYVPQHQTGRTMSLIRLAINLGMSAAPTIGGFIAVSAGYSLLFWVDGATCILAAVFFAVVSRNWSSTKQQATPGLDKMETRASKIHPLRYPGYLTFLAVTFFVAFCFIQWFHTVPVYIKTDLGFDERYIGILLGLSSVYIILVEMPAIHHIEKSGALRPALRLGIFLLLLSYLPFLTSAALWMCFVSVILWTSGEILFLPLNNAKALSLSPAEERGSFMAWYWMMWSLANIAAPILGLYIAEQFGFHTLWVAIAFLLPLVLYLNNRVNTLDTRPPDLNK